MAGDDSLNMGYQLNEEKLRAVLERNPEFQKAFIRENGKRAFRRQLSDPDFARFFYTWQLSFRDINENPDEDDSNRETRLETIMNLTPEEAENFDFREHFDPSMRLRLDLEGNLVGFSRSVIVIPELADSLNTLHRDSTAQRQNLFFTSAEKLIEQTAWANFDLSRGTFTRNTTDSDGNYTVDVRFTISDAPLPSSLGLSLSSEGHISGMRLIGNFEEPERGVIGKVLNVILVGVFPVFIVLLLLGQFFKRQYARLIDLSIAKYDALAFGFLFSFVLGIQAATQEYQGAIPDFGALLIGLGVFLGGGLLFSALAVVVFSTADSLSQEAWPRKKYSFALFRQGFINNKMVGKSVSRGLSAGFFMTLAYVLLYGVTDSAISSFYGESVVSITAARGLVALIHHPITSIISAIIVVFLFILVPGSWLKLRGAPNWLLITLLSLFSSQVFIFAPEAGNFYITYLLRFAIVLVPVLVFLRYDIVSSCITLITFASVMLGLHSLILPVISDFLMVLMCAALITGIAAIGFVGLNSTVEYNELPDLEPEYIKRLAREQRIEKEFELAREVHDSFLASARPSVEGYDIASSCKTAYEVGGDYYDFITLNEHKTLVVIADVSGKGVKAAFYMTLVKGYLQSVSEQTEDVAEIIKTVNRLFYANSPRGTFITVLAGVLDTKTNTFTFVRAGHDPLYFLGGAGRGIQVYQPKGFALGMARPEVFNTHLETRRIELSTGQPIILFTDGYPESFNLNRQQLGEARLKRIIQASFAQSDSSVQLLDGIRKRVASYVSGARQHDDMTMIVINRSLSLPIVNGEL